MTEEPQGVEVLDRDECPRLLTTQSVGRVGITVQALPVNFGLLGDAVVFRTTPGTKLDTATNEKVVAFEVDSYESDGRSGWGVLLVGKSSRMLDDEIARAEALNVVSWALDNQAAHFVRIEASQVTGRRFHRSR